MWWLEGVTEKFQHWPLDTTGAGVTVGHSSAQQSTAAGPHLSHEVVLITGEIFLFSIFSALKGESQKSVKFALPYLYCDF